MPPPSGLTTAAGRTLAADAVVLATGATPRMLPGQAQVAGVHVVRTLDDALRLRAELRPVGFQNVAHAREQR